MIPIADQINGTSRLHFTTGVLIGGLLTTAFFRWALSKSETVPSLHPLGSQARLIDHHIQNTQKPAKALGIRVEDFDEVEGKFLALMAPLEQNTNVHGTAFAGSLFSIGCLSSFYLVRQWMENQGLLKGNTLVAKSATIRYIRPVKSPWIIATSTLPINNDASTTMAKFAEQLKTKGKATVQVSGKILQTNPDEPSKSKVACEYSVECCAYHLR